VPIFTRNASRRSLARRSRLSRPLSRIDRADSRADGERIRFEGATARQSRLYAALISLPTVDPFTFDAMRAALRPGDTYAFQMGLPPSAPAGSWIETFSRYYLLPHLMVPRAREADVVLSFHASPRTLGVRVTDVRHVAHDLIVSRVVRDGT
jgi:hypothetical protein